MLDLCSFFETISSENYCIIKMSHEFPNYSPGGDVDIFCYNPSQIAQKIFEWAHQHAKEYPDINVNTDTKHNHIAVDFMDRRDIHLRFDVFGQLPNYKNVLIRPALFESIIEHSRSVSYQQNGRTFEVKVPSQTDEMILRYIEFIEWYNVRPDKIKHLDYIVERIDEDKQAQFLDRLHHYTALPEYPVLNQPEKLPLTRRVCAKLKRISQGQPS